MLEALAESSAIALSTCRWEGPEVEISDQRQDGCQKAEDQPKIRRRLKHSKDLGRTACKEQQGEQTAESRSIRLKQHQRQVVRHDNGAITLLLRLAAILNSSSEAQHLLTAS